MDNIIVSIDGHCFIPHDIYEQYGIYSIPFEIVLDGQLYKDDLMCITMKEVIEKYNTKKIFPKTAAIAPDTYKEFFNKKLDEGYKIIHINLASGGSACYNNCKLAIDNLETSQDVFQFDSQNISCGLLILAIYATKLIKEYNDITIILEKLIEYRSLLRSSYCVSTLEFLTRGGRLEKRTQANANEGYEIVVRDNKIEIESRFNGNFRTVVENMFKNKFSNLPYNKEFVFVDISILPPKSLPYIKNLLKKYEFKKIYILNSTCSCAGHWGPNAFGLYFTMKE